MTEHRSWFPFIVVGLSLALLAVVALVYTPATSPNPTNVVTAPELTAPSAEEYAAIIQQVLADYALDNDAVRAYNTLLLTRVPNASYQSFHLNLVIAFAELQSGNGTDGAANLAGVIAAAPWLSAN